jgi:Fur family ferric uptake transcriptional regulator
VAAEFTDKLRETFGFDTDMKHFAIFGRCADCSAKAEKAARTGKAAPSGRGGDAGRSAPDDLKDSNTES